MEIQRAQPTDIDEIMGIYDYARAFMARTGNPVQWGRTNWPPRALIEEDIRQQNSYLCVEDGKILAVFYYNCGRAIDPCYLTIDGAWLGDDTYGVVHRIAATGGARGAGTFCINWAYEQCGHLRMDTHGDNIIMQNLLRKLGFRYCGIIHVVEDDDPRLAFEKLPS